MSTASATLSLRRILAEKRAATQARDVLLVDEGRYELLPGHAARALAYLRPAFAGGQDATAVRFLLASAARLQGGRLMPASRRP